MGVKLQKYTRQVGVQPGFAGTEGSLEAAGAPWAAIGRAADVVGGIAGDYGERIVKHKNEGDIAGYENDKRAFDENLKLRKQEARLAGVKDEQMMEKVIVPAMEEFTKRQEGKGFSKSVQGFVDTDWGHKVNAVYTEEQAEILQSAIAKGNLQKVEYAKALERDGFIDDADEIWSGLESTMKPEQLAKERSQSRVGREFVTIRQADIDYSEGRIDETEYRGILEESNNRIQADKGVLEDDKHRHKTETIGKISTVARRKAVEVNKAWTELRSLDKAGKLGGAELESLERVVGKQNVDILMEKNYQSLKKASVTDAESRKSIALINKVINGEIKDFNKAISQTKKIDGKAGKRAFWQITEIFKERIDANAEESTPVKSFRTDYFEHVSRFILLDKEGRFRAKEGWYDERMDAFETWKADNPKASQDDYYDFRYQQLKEDVAEYAGTFVAPQTPTKPIDTKAIWDSL